MIKRMFVEKGRTIYNRLTFVVMFLVKRIFSINEMLIFSDSNGWFLTYGYKNYIYKIVGPFTFLKPNLSFSDLKASLMKLDRMNKAYIPKIRTNMISIQLKYIDGSQNLIQYLSSVNNSKDKLEIFSKVFSAVNDLHSSGFSHGDLKPKNILVKDCEVYLIDLEAITELNACENDILIDYLKLIPRLIYFLNKDEFFEFASCIENTLLKDNVLSYGKYFDVHELIKSLDFVEFEKNEYSEDEDIDITIPNHGYLKDVIKEVERLNVDYRVSYYANDDIKVFIYNQRIQCSLDVHLHSSIPYYYFLYLKYFINIRFNFFFAGPDGSGKSTIISELLKRLKNKELFQYMYVDSYHSNRRFRDMNMLKIKRVNRFMADRFGGVFLKNIGIFRDKLKAKNLISLCDRSLFDQFIYKKRFNKNLAFLKFLYVKDYTFLLHSPAELIVKRKDELSLEQINNYYEDYFFYYKKYIKIDNDDIQLSLYQIESNIRYFTYTNKL